LRLAVLGGFRLYGGGDASLEVTGEAQRLLSLLALRDRAVQRTSVAGTLWPDVPDSHSHASLRSSLSRLERKTRAFVKVRPLELSLAPEVAVDLRAAQALARRLLTKGERVGEADLGAGAVNLLSDDLLPDWYDDWVVVEAEEWRQLRLHALEALADCLIDAGRFSDAASAAHAAIKVDPLRESAHAALIRVHIAEGNQSEALREFGRYDVLLHDELGLEPTSRLRRLVHFSSP
jgi:DNA-binding SARP family transcriptional activator